MTAARVCRAEGCTTTHQRSMLMCRRHWLGLPKTMRDEHWRICRDPELGVFSDEWSASAAACFAYWSSTP